MVWGGEEGDHPRAELIPVILDYHVVYGFCANAPRIHENLRLKYMWERIFFFSRGAAHTSYGFTKLDLERSHVTRSRSYHSTQS